MNALDGDFSLVGETLGIWRLLRGIGRGGMGEVYEAEYDYLPLLLSRNRMLTKEQHQQLKAELSQLSRPDLAAMAGEVLGSSLPPASKFAIKVSTSRVKTAGHKRFLQEAELAKRLGEHPHIVTVEAIHTPRGDATGGDLAGMGLAMTRNHDVAFMVMELAQTNYDFRQLTVPQAAYIVRCIASALDHAHALNIVHRDIKPENILGPIEHPLLTDFGIAKELDKTKSQALTVTGQVIGTLDYMSPEQAGDAKKVDHRSDIYSLGVVLYEFATNGQLPYMHLVQREAALTAIRSERIEPKWPSDHVAKFPKSLERIILKAIAHHPSQRYQGMSELVRDLDTFAADRWVPWIGRVHPKRYLRHVMQKHPRIMIGVPVAVLLAVLTWVALSLPQWFDQTRRQLEAEIASYSEHIDALTQGRKQQLTRAERDIYVNNLQLELADHEHEYPQLFEQYQNLEKQRLARRWLRVDFTDDQKLRAKEELETALVGGRGSWAVTSQGLKCAQQSVLRLGPYGSGIVYLNMLAELPDADGVDIIVQEHGETIQRHRTGLRVVEEELRVIHAVDRRAAIELYRRDLPSPATLDCSLQVSERGVRADLLGDQIFKPIEALRHAHPAEITIVLPAGTVLRYLEIQPAPVLSR